MSKIILEHDGIKVGDKVEYNGYEGYVAVIDTTGFFLLRLENFIGHSASVFWEDSYYPESEKKEEENCRWLIKEEFRVINDEHKTLSGTSSYTRSEEAMDNVQSKLIKKLKSLTAKRKKLDSEINK